MAKRSRILPPPEWPIIRRMLCRPRWLFGLAWEFLRWGAYCLRNRRRPSQMNVTFRLVALWPAPLITREDAEEFNRGLHEFRREQLGVLDRLRARKAELESGHG